MLNRVIAWLLLVIFVTATALQSCVKQDHDYNESSNSDSVNYEQYGRIVSDHFKYYNDDVNPLSYLNFPDAGSLISEVQSLQSQNKGLSIENRLSSMVSAEVFYQNHADNFLQLYNEIDAAVQSNPNFDFIWNFLLAKESELENKGNLDVNEKDMLMVYCAILRYSFKVANDRGEFNPTPERDGCFLGRKTSCWLKVLTATFLDAIKTILEAIFKPSEIGKNEKGDPIATKIADLLVKTVLKSLLKKVWIGIAITIIFEIVKMYLDKECECVGPTNPPGGQDCKKPASISLRASGCGLTQRFEVTGAGNDVARFHWVIKEGNNQRSEFTTTPSLTITQQSASVPLEISVFTNCNNGNNFSIGPVHFNLVQELGNAGTINILGPRLVTVGEETVFSLNGNASFNSNNQIIVEPNSGGIVVSQSPGEVKMKFFQATESGFLRVTSTNGCSQRSTTETYTFVVR